MLHGYSQNANIFSKRMAAVRKSMAKDDVEFVFVDAPVVLQPADIPSNWGVPLEALGAGEASAAEEDPSLTPRGWWRANPDREIVAGLDESIALLRDMLKKDRYVGIFGFSQGAAMAAIVSALLEKPEVHPPFLVDGKAPHPPLSFCVAVSGFRPTGALCAALFTPSYSTPTLHILGKGDIIVVEERSQGLINVSSNKRVLVHDGGHFVPLKSSWRNFFKEYFLKPSWDVPTPSGAVSNSASDDMPTT
ncbi:FSH1-domain-containing protein [Heliocybe sulcata]|uniref:FSH1-domain-containing protein n=1 Tax=Heliocybe sulcata TaxID=5364 RepID=A0A5C3MYI7_9AGAM|nr:FSH1-domain-containing protein [Heliocybe sulcata]